MSISGAPLLRGRVTQSTGANNATATATATAVGDQRHLILGVEAHYGAAVAAIKTVTVKSGTATLQTFRWDFTNGPFFFSFPVALRGEVGAAVSVELEASGSGGVSGYASIYTATD
jgi:hypothetical protein